MNKWPLVSLGEIFDIARGGSPRPIDSFITDSEDGVNWVSISDASESSKYINSTKRKIIRDGVSRSRLVHSGDFLLTNSMSFGRPYIMNTSGCIHDGWLVLSKKKENVDQDYFYHLLGAETTYRKFKSVAAGAVVKNLNIDLVRSIKVPLPPLKEQKRIAAILDKADSLRHKRKQAVLITNDFLCAVFLKMFGDPEKNPKMWPTTRLDEISLRITDGEHQTPQRSTEGIYLLSARNIKDGYLDFSDVDYVPQSEYERIRRRCEPVMGDILISCSGSIGRVAQVNVDVPLTLVRSVALVRPNPALVRGGFLEHLLRTPSLQRSMQKASKSSAQANLFQAPIKALNAILPPIEMQDKFEQIRINTLKARKKLMRSSDEYLAFSAALQNTYF